MMKQITSGTIRIPLIYALFGLLWIVITDRLLLYLNLTTASLVRWQTYKGWLFVGLSTLVIYMLVARYTRQTVATKEALADSEKRYRLLFNNNPLPMWVYDLETLAFLEVNDAAVEKYGFLRTEFLQQTIKDIRPAEDVPLLLEDVAHTTAPLNFAGEWRHLRKDDTVFPVEIISHMLTYNGRSARLVVAKDLTDQKRVEAERANIFQRNQALVQALGEIVYEWFPQQNRVIWEGEYERILGFSPDGMGEDTESWTGKIHPEDRDRVVRAVNQAHEQKQNLDIEYRFLQADGSYRWMLDRGVIVYDEQGELEKVVGVFLDIHARKQAEAALQESEERFRRAIEFAPFPILIHAEDGDVLAVSQTWLEITGYELDEISTIEKWTELAYGPEQARVVAGIDRLYELDGRVDEGEFVITCKDSSIRIWEFSSTPLGRLPDGRRGVISIAVDTTERRAVENQLHLQSSALNAAANGIVVTDINGMVEWANPAFSELTGYSLTEALGKNPRDLVKSGAHSKQFYEEMWNTILAGDVWRGELINKRKDNTLYIEEEAITPVWNENGEMTHFIAIKQDITQRKQAEEEREQLLEQVKSQAEQMEQIMQSVPEGILLLNAEGKILTANARAEAYLLLLAQAAVGDQLRQLGDISWTRLLTSPDPGGWHEIRQQDQIFEAVAQPVAAGPVAQGWVLVLRQVTEQKRLEEQLHRQERLAAVGQLAAGIAHDFNNLMAVILLYSQLLARSDRVSLKEREQLKMISRQAKRAARLIEQILDFSRRAVFERRPLDLLVLLKEEVKLLQRTLPENIEIDLKHEAESAIVLADVTRIQQTIMNLAFNARDAMPEGGQMRFSLQHYQVDDMHPAPVAGMGTGRWVCFSVSDTGTGIDPAIMDHIFEPFVTTKEPGKGTGLGLSQVQGIVAQHEGFIDVHSQASVGSTFDIYLPALVAEPDETVVRPPQTAVSGQGQRLLVVEDEPDLRSALVERLALWQYKVLAAANGEEALAMLQAGTAVDLIISDIIMPKMGGQVFVKTLRDLGIATPVIFITGHPIDIDHSLLRGLGVKSVLSKPIPPAQLSHAIAAALAESGVGE